MKNIIDKFSNQSEIYKKYRPGYPKELYDFILATIKLDDRNECWDCGTGNGQVAKVLSKYFKTIHATDISANQINHAEKNPNIAYSITRSEKTPFKENQFDLITVAQAIHWFDIKAFTSEVKRVGKNGSKICVWGYGLINVDEKVNPIIQRFYNDLTGPYWNTERRHIDSNYETINFDFAALEAPKNLKIRSNWKLDELIGFLNSWSAVQNYMKENNGENPVEKIVDELAEVWPGNIIKQVSFPIFMKIGIIEK